MTWQPSDVIAVVAVIIAPLGGLLVAAYTAHQQRRADKQRDRLERRAAVEEALAAVTRLHSLMPSLTYSVLIRDPEPFWVRARDIAETVPMVEQAIEKLTAARVRHPGPEVRAAIAELNKVMSGFAAFTRFCAWLDENRPEDENLARWEEQVGTTADRIHGLIQTVEERLNAFHEAA